MRFPRNRNKTSRLIRRRFIFEAAQRDYVIIDAPGHQEFLKNMITGAANADAAVVVIAADEGVREQSRRHGQLLSLLGIREIIVAVNKMDLVGFGERALSTDRKRIRRRSCILSG